MPNRRTWLLGIGASAMLAGCGFHLRQAPTLPFRTVQLVGFSPHSSLARDLKQGIDSSPDSKVVDSLPQAQAVLEALVDRREVSVVASTSSSQVTELQLRTRFSFRLHTPSGHQLIAPTEILLFRDLTYTETAALAKEEEQEVLYRGMQSDIVDQVLRRLSAARL